MHEFSDQKKPRELRTCIVCSCTFEEFVHKKRRCCTQKCYHQSRIGTTISDKHKQIISESRKRDWANGTTYVNATVGKTKWYDHVKPSGESIRLQGKWELAYAQYLDEKQIAYIAHKGAIPYIRSSDNTNRIYLPDFYLTETDEYVDVKNDYLLRLDKRKLEDIRTCNPTIKLIIVTKAILKTMNVLKN